MGLTKFIFQRIMGWKIQGYFDEKIKKAVVIVVPHTSWHDFYIGAFTRKVINIEINYVAKKELFLRPFGWYFRWMGGAPLDRTSGQNNVEAITEIFKKKDTFRLAMAPEGTRKKVSQWKTGFYYIAKNAEVPIISVAFDYKTRRVIIYEPFYPTGDIENDLIFLRSNFKNIVGKIPEHS